MIYAMSDIHGSYDRARELLLEHGIVDSQGNWRAGEATLVVTGDSVDRGSHGYKVVRMLKHLQQQANWVGGRVVHLLGNHDMWMIGEVLGRKAGGSKIKGWVGETQEADVRAFVENPDVFDWFQNCPVVCRIGNILFQHADAMLYYLNFGNRTTTGDRLIQQINERVNTRMQYSQAATLQGDRLTFARNWDGMEKQIQDYLDVFDATHVVHGHSPNGCQVEPMYYQKDKIILIDGMMTDHGRGYNYVPWLHGNKPQQRTEAGILLKLEHDNFTFVV